MKITKRILSIALAVCCCIIGTTSVSAAEPKTTTFDLPDDAVILYQDEDAVLYQSKSESEFDSTNVANSARTAVDYESVWVNNSEWGSFTIYNSRSGKTGVTWKVESPSSKSHAQIYMTTPQGLLFLDTRDVYEANGDVYFRTTGVKGTYTIHYIATTTVGMRIMCWMYDI